MSETEISFPDSDFVIIVWLQHGQCRVRLILQIAKGLDAGEGGESDGNAIQHDDEVMVFGGARERKLEALLRKMMVACVR